MKLLRSISSIATALVLAATLSASCTTPTKPDSFYGAVVTCTLENSQNRQAGAAVLNCLTGAMGGDYVACLSGLVTAGYWTVEEVACIVRQYSTEAAQKLNAKVGGVTDELVLARANDWIKTNKVFYR